MPEHYSNFGEAAGAAMAHNARMAAEHAEHAVARAAFDAVRAAAAATQPDFALAPPAPQEPTVTDRTPQETLTAAELAVLLRVVLGNVQLTGSGCWVWTGSLDIHGYGKKSLNDRTIGAHRWMWALLRGPILAGLELDHLCRVRACINPEHLEPVSPAKNIRRGHAARGKYSCRKHGPKIRRPSGDLVCRPCDAEKAQLRRAGVPVPREVRTRCPNEHELAEVGVYVDKKGARCCKECRREAGRRYKARKGSATLPAFAFAHQILGEAS